jgi:DNA-binding HxlR family transcriptional regulator
MLEGKYSAHILKELLSGTQRFNGLLKKIPGISKKTLSDKLKNFTDHGVVTRYVHAEIPPKVEYQLTSQGEALKQIIGNLETLGSMIETKPAATDRTSQQASVVQVYRGGVRQSRYTHPHRARGMPDER